MKIYKPLFLLILLIASKNSYAQFDYFQNITKDPTGNAVGFETKATGLNATAIGEKGSASGLVSMAAGYATTASGTASTALNWFSTASGTYSISTGFYTKASGVSSTAMGDNTKALGRSTIATGWLTTASGKWSTAMGANTTAFGWSSTALGYSTRADAYGSLVIGRYNVGGGDSVNWIGTDPLFEIGNGKTIYDRTNAVTVYKNGTFNISSLKGAGSRMVVADASGNLSTQAVPGGDNLGNHTATQNIHLNGKWLSGDASNKGIKVDVDGKTTVYSTNTTTTLSLGNTFASKKLALLDNINFYGFGVQSGQMRLQVGNTNDKFSFFAGDAAEVMTVKGNGNVGIKSTNPSCPLSLGASIITKKFALYDTPDWYGLGIAPGQMRLQVGNTGARFAFFAGDNLEVMSVRGNNNGQVGIGIVNVPVGYKLGVDGKIVCEELLVKPSEQWPDYVFEKNYKLMPLSSLETYIEKNKHLPDMPSAAVVEKEGIQVAEMNAKLLQKVEELTLYLLDLKKENEGLKARLEALENVKK